MLLEIFCKAALLSLAGVCAARTTSRIASAICMISMVSLTAFNGASILFEILCLVEEAWRARREIA